MVDSIVKQLFNLINNIESLGFDMSKVKTIIHNLPDRVEFSDLHSRYFRIYDSLDDKYGIYCKMKAKLDYIDYISDENMDSSVLKRYIYSYIDLLNKFKNDENFVNDSFSSFISYFYSIGYKLMKLELLINDSDVLFLYFKSNPHDLWYVSEFIKSEVCDLESSINNIFGLKELKELIKEKTNNEESLYLDKDIIDFINICVYPDKYKKIFNIKLMTMLKELKLIWNYMFLFFTEFEATYFPKNFVDNRTTSYILKYKEWLDKYYNFIDRKDFLINNDYKIRVRNIGVDIDYYAVRMRIL